MNTFLSQTIGGVDFYTSQIVFQVLDWVTYEISFKLDIGKALRLFRVND